MRGGVGAPAKQDVALSVARRRLRHRRGDLGAAGYLRSANASATFNASAAVSACVMLEATATTTPLSRRASSDITLPPASSPVMLAACVARAKRTRSDGVE